MAADVSVLEEVRAESARPVPIRDGHRVALALVAAVGLACGLSPLVGGFYAISTWGLIALVALAVAGGLLLGGQSAPPRLALVALLGLVAVAGISLLSITWAESADNALTGASRWILYASAFGVLVVAARNPRVARVGVAAAAGGIVVVGIYIVAVMTWGDGPSLFLVGRLNEPLGYVNSEGLFLVVGICPLVGLAQYGRPVAAGLAAAATTVLAALALLTQSRSVALAFAAAALAVLALLPGRLSRAWLLVLVSGAVAAISSPLLDLYDLGRLDDPTFAEAITTAAKWIVLAAVVVGVGWGAIIAVARRFRGPGPRAASAVALGVLALVGAGLLVARADSVRTYLHDQVRAFTTLKPNLGGGRLLSGGGNRYDYWRIAAHEFSEYPVAGVGADNYTREYFIRRRSSQDDVRQPHSIEMQTLAELGVLGGVALGVFLLAVGFGTARHLRARSRAPADRALLVGGIGAFCAWLAHASVDWSHLLPGAVGITLLAAAYLVASPNADADPTRPARHGLAGVATRALIGAGIVAAAVIVGRSFLADHYLDSGKTALRAHPVQAIRDANNSLAFNGDSAQARYLQSAGYARLGDYDRARQPLLRATRLEPHSFVPWALLGDLAARRGDMAVARRSYTRASQLNPLDRGLRRLRDRPGP